MARQRASPNCGRQVIRRSPLRVCDYPLLLVHPLPGLPPPVSGIRVAWARLRGKNCLEDVSKVLIWYALGVYENPSNPHPIEYLNDHRSPALPPLPRH